MSNRHINIILPVVGGIADGGISQGNAINVLQTNHGFVVGQALRRSLGLYVLAQANTDDNAEVIGVVQSVKNANNFTLVTGGLITALSDLIDGAVYFLSATDPGELTVDEPDPVIFVSKPILLATSTTTAVVTIMRGLRAEDIVTPGGGGGLTYDEMVAYLNTYVPPIEGIGDIVVTHSGVETIIGEVDAPLDHIDAGTF